MSLESRLAAFADRVADQFNTVSSALTSGLAGKANSTHSHAESDVTGLTTDLAAKQDTSAKGQASGYASLDGSTKVPIAQIPTGTSSSTVAIGNDSRLSDARTPTAHASSHATAGSDPISPASIGAVPTARTVSAGTGLTGGGDLSADRTLTVAYGTSSTTACVGDDSRLSNSRTPSGTAGGDLTGTYPNPTVSSTAWATERSATATLTNKRITKRVGSTTSTATLTYDSDSYDQYNLTAQAAALSLANPSGTPTDAQQLMIRIKDNGTARALTWSGTQWRAMGVTLPTTTVISKTLYIGAAWNATDSKWDVLAIGQEA